MSIEVSLLPQDVDIRIPIADVAITFQLEDGTGAPLDITLDSAKLTVCDVAGEIIRISTNDPGEHATPADGKTTFTFALAEFADLPRDRVTVWRYSVRRIVAGSGAELAHISGTLYVHP